MCMHLWYAAGVPVSAISAVPEPQAHVRCHGMQQLARGAQVIHIEVGERARARRVAVAVRQRAQLLQALGDRGREAVLAGHVRVQDDVCMQKPLR